MLRMSKHSRDQWVIHAPKEMWLQEKPWEGDTSVANINFFAFLVSGGCKSKHGKQARNPYPKHRISQLTPWTLSAMWNKNCERVIHSKTMTTYRRPNPNAPVSEGSGSCEFLSLAKKRSGRNTDGSGYIFSSWSIPHALANTIEPFGILQPRYSSASVVK